MNRSEVEFLTPTPMTVLAFSRNLLTKGEKSESPLDDDKRVDVALCVTEIERVDDHADVSGVFPDWRKCGNLNEFESRLVQVALEHLVAVKSQYAFLTTMCPLSKRRSSTFWISNRG